MQRQIANPLEVPEDVLAELDIGERRVRGGELPRPDGAPEVVRSELDREARVADEQQRTTFEEGTPPALDDERTS